MNTGISYRQSSRILPGNVNFSGEQSVGESAQGLRRKHQEHIRKGSKRDSHLAGGVLATTISPFSFEYCTAIPEAKKNVMAQDFQVSEMKFVQVRVDF